MNIFINHSLYTSYSFLLNMRPGITHLLFIMEGTRSGTMKKLPSTATVRSFVQIKKKDEGLVPNF
jgi:hypothetical protein